jgi:N-carbamoylputrescine amidase
MTTPLPTSTIGIVSHPCSESWEKNIALGEAGVVEAAEKGAKIICLQELFHWTYFCTIEDAARCDLAEPASGRTVERMRKLAQKLGIVLVVPFYERRAPGIYHNSAAVIEKDGSVLGIYRKMHIPDDPLYYEKYYFTPGDSSGPHGGYKVFKTSEATIGVLICWDQWYPEGARITALMGAEILFFPTAIGWHPKERDTFGDAQVHAWQTAQKAHAIANGVYVASPNRIGHEATPGTDGLTFFGRSFIADPFGRVLTEDTEGNGGVLTAPFHRGLIEETRRNWPFLRDRRIDAFSPILSRYIDAK